MNHVLDVASGASVRDVPASPRRCRPKRQDVVFGYVVLGCDVVTLVGIFLLAYSVRGGVARFGELLPLRDYLWVLATIIAIALPIARLMGLTDSHAYRHVTSLVATTVKAHVAAGLLLLSVLYLMRAVDVSRLFMQVFLVASGVAVIAERLAIRQALTLLERHRPAHARRILVVGTSPAALRFHQMLEQRPHWGAEVVGFVAADRPAAALFCRLPVLGSLDDVPMLLDTTIVDEVILADVVSPARTDALTRACLDRGATFHALVRMPASAHARHHAETLGEGLYLISLETTPHSTVLLSVKRVLDVVGAACGLAACALVFLVFALPIRLGSRGPIIFRQTRVGRNGRLFTLFKFRTMRSDAEACKADLRDANAMRGHLFKVPGDPRVTAVGRFLRRSYLDELPQFWNVLKGEMSLVGTRPPVPEEVAAYSPHHRRRLSMRPGLTGLWQTTGNGRVTDFEQVVRLDCEYIDRWSIWLDVQVVLRTLLTVARMGGQ